jgi:hypothetical protein
MTLHDYELYMIEDALNGKHIPKIDADKLIQKLYKEAHN